MLSAPAGLRRRESAERRLRKSLGVSPAVRSKMVADPPTGRHTDAGRTGAADVAAWSWAWPTSALIGFAGRFVEEKGFDYLLARCRELVEATPRVHLVYAGRARVVYEDFFERCAPLLERHREHVTFVGLLRDRQRLANFYAMCDVFVLPSRTDLFGAVQLEAMLCGTPVVASDIPGAREPVCGRAWASSSSRETRPRSPPGCSRSCATSRASVGRGRRSRPSTTRNRASTRTRRLLGGAGADAETEPLTPPTARTARTAARERSGHGVSPPSPVLLEYLELADGTEVLDCGCGMGFYLLAIGALTRVRTHRPRQRSAAARLGGARGRRARARRGDIQGCPSPTHRSTRC